VLEPPDAVVVDPAVVELVDFLLDDPHALSTSTAVRTIPTTWYRRDRPPTRLLTAATLPATSARVSGFFHPMVLSP
jgi:hypothetical protein